MLTRRGTIFHGSYRGEMTHFTFTAGKSKLSLSLMLFLLTLALANRFDIQIDNSSYFWNSNCGINYIMNGSALEGNLKVVLNSLVENVNKTGYNTSWYGGNGDKMYGLAQCRGDLNASTCRACVSYATKSITHCSGSSTFSINLSGCFLKYATSNFYSSLSDASIDYSDSVAFCDENKINGTGGNIAKSLDWGISSLLTRVNERAVSSNVSYNSTTSGNYRFFPLTNNYTVYSLAQCWRDLSINQCALCLDTLFNVLSYCPSGTSHGAGFNENCMIEFTTHKFYGDDVPLLLPRGGTEGENRVHVSLILKWSIAGIVIMVVLPGLVVFWKRKYKKQLVLGVYIPLGELSTAISKSKLNYKYRTLKNATKNFSPTNKIGQGGFGCVYKGVLPNGKEIAVKRLFFSGEQSVSDFFNEVNLISRVQHKNLVKLLGCNVDGIERLLVYEYLPNKSLDHFLFDENMGNMLNWERRFEIILGIASGLAYLHQESDTRIIHRDIKASNILLDQHFKPKIADFGSVRYFAEDQTHLSTRIIGTRGYMAPEYLVHGHLTEKVDVYAYGVLVLEIISGRKNVTPMNTNDMPSLLNVVWNHYLSSTLSNIIDSNIQQNYKEEVLQVVHIALLCTQTSATLRPSMSKVIVLLTSKDPNIPAATHPPFIGVIHSESGVASSSSQSNINIGVQSNHSESNMNTSFSHAWETYNPSIIASSPAIENSLNTISTSSFGPR